jgi:hypothetical protein
MTHLDYEKDRRNRLPKDVPRDPINDATRKSRPRERRHPLLRDIERQTRELNRRIGPSSTEGLKEAISSLIKLIKAFYAEMRRGATEIANARTMIDRAKDKMKPARAIAPKRLPGPGPFRRWKVKVTPRSKRPRSGNSVSRKRKSGVR